MRKPRERAQNPRNLKHHANVHGTTGATAQGKRGKLTADNPKNGACEMITYFFPLPPSCSGRWDWSKMNYCCTTCCMYAVANTRHECNGTTKAKQKRSTENAEPHVGQTWQIPQTQILCAPRTARANEGIPMPVDFVMTRHNPYSRCPCKPPRTNTESVVSSHGCATFCVLTGCRT